MSGQERGFGVAAGLDPAICSELATYCEGCGYASMWSNDHPAASGLETLVAFARGSDQLDLGVGALALDRHTPETVAADIGRLGLDSSRLMLAFGAGFTKRPLKIVREGVAALRKSLPEDVRIQVAAMGPKMCALGGEIADGIMLNWMTPERSNWARELIVEGADRANRQLPPMVGYVRVAIDDRAPERLLKEEQFYRELHEGYRKHFQGLGSEVGTVGIAVANDPALVQRQLGEYSAFDLLIVRALASATVESMVAVATVAAPTST